MTGPEGGEVGRLLLKIWGMTVVRALLTPRTELSRVHRERKHYLFRRRCNGVVCEVGGNKEMAEPTVGVVIRRVRMDVGLGDSG